MKKFFLLLVLLNYLLIDACSTTAKDHEEITGQSLVNDRRTYEAMVIDDNIETTAYSELNSDEDLRTHCHFVITAFNGTVLVTGEAPDEELKEKIISTVREIPNVKLVHNNLAISAPIDANSLANDTLITDTIRIALKQIRTIPDFDPSMVKVITENGTVYLMGLVHRNEGAVVINVTKLQPGIKQIIVIFEYLD